MFKTGAILIFLALFATWSDDSRKDILTNGEPNSNPASTTQTPGKDRYIESSDAVGLGDVIGYGRGAAFVDINGDGFDDLFVADTDDRHRTDDFGVSQMYLNKQDGTFEPVDIGIDADDLIGTWVGSFADYDRDGDPDLLIVNGG